MKDFVRAIVDDRIELVLDFYGSSAAAALAVDFLAEIKGASKGGFTLLPPLFLFIFDLASMGIEKFW